MTHIKRFVLPALILSVFATPILSHAQTPAPMATEERQALINSIIKQLIALQIQLNDMLAKQASAVTQEVTGVTIPLQSIATPTVPSQPKCKSERKADKNGVMRLMLCSNKQGGF